MCPDRWVEFNTPTEQRHKLKYLRICPELAVKTHSAGLCFCWRSEFRYYLTLKAAFSKWPIQCNDHRMQLEVAVQTD